MQHPFLDKTLLNTGSFELPVAPIVTCRVVSGSVDFTGMLCRHDFKPHIQEWERSCNAVSQLHIPFVTKSNNAACHWNITFQ